MVREWAIHVSVSQKVFDEKMTLPENVKIAFFSPGSGISDHFVFIVRTHKLTEAIDLVAEKFGGRGNPPLIHWAVKRKKYM